MKLNNIIEYLIKNHDYNEKDEIGEYKRRFLKQT